MIAHCSTRLEQKRIPGAARAGNSSVLPIAMPSRIAMIGPPTTGTSEPIQKEGAAIATTINSPGNSFRMPFIMLPPTFRCRFSTLEISTPS